MASEIYTSTQWENYPSTSTPITAAELNRMEKAILEVPKETATFLLNAATGGLKSEVSATLSTTRWTEISGYNPTNGDKLVVWRSNSVPCAEGDDYELSEENGTYSIKSKGWSTTAHIQIWNIPTGSSTQTSGAAYPNISNLTTDSISGTVTQGE